MAKTKTFKLYTLENEYKCKVNLLEIAFLFGIDSENVQEINEAIKAHGYYIK